MPPSVVGGFLGSVGNWLTGASQSKDDQKEPNAAPYKDHNDNDIDSKRAGGQVHGERGAKKPRLSKDEERLLQPQYTKVPKDAKPIALPTSAKYDPRADWEGRPQRVAQASMAAGPRRGGFRPLDTLKQNARQSGKSSGAEPGHFKRFAAQPPQQLQTRGSQGSNVSSRPDFEEGSRPPKKRKMSNTPVDLTDDVDDEPFGQAVGRPNGRMQPTSQASSSSLHGKSKRKDALFASNEQNSVHQLLNPGGTLTGSQTAKNGIVLSDRASARTSERAKSVIDDSRSGVGTKGSPVQLDVDNLPKRKTHRSAGHPQLPPRQRANLPTIDLDDGVDEYTDEYLLQAQKRRGNTAQGSWQDMTGVDDVFSGRTQEKAAPDQARPPRPPNGPSFGQSTTQTTQKGRAGAGARVVHDLDYVPRESRLADTFRRDDGEEQKPRPAKLVKQMQTTSASNRISLNSEDDVLSGPRTIPGTTSQDASPRKQPAEDHANFRPEAERIHEDSNRTATKVARVRHPVAAASTRAPHSTLETDDHAVADDVRIPILGIFCKACVLHQKGLELLWDHDLSAFVVVSNRKKVRTPDNKSVVKIGALEAHLWKQAKGVTGIWLCGSVTESSSGHILIEFADDGGMTPCYEHLLWANKTLKIVPVAPQTLLNVFNKKPIELQKAYELLKQKASRPTQLVDDSHSRRQSRQHEEEEQIVYENDDEPQQRPLKARERMQGDTLGEVLGQQGYQDSRKTQKRDEIVSKFFPSAEEPRRSTRQSKPVQVKERTPSPVRWTRTHNPERWTHSVVYPDSGPRRVTVDYQDLERLDEGEFLNDNVVNFELRCIEENMEPQHKSKVHFFNTYFFSSLSQKNGKKDFNYGAVERWTKKIDLFNVPYIVVPINVELHWFVAIICNLPAIERKFNGFDDLVNEPPNNTNEAEQSEAEGKAAPSDASLEPNSSVKGGSSPANNVIEFGEDGKVAAARADDTEEVAPTSRPSTATGRKGKKKGPALRKYDPKEPIIMSLDSFAIQRSAEIKYLKLYVSAEAKTKRGISLEPGTLQGMSAKGIPEQPNFCDCGVYLLGYVAEFAKDPDTFVRKVLNREMDRENDFASFDASAKRVEIRDKVLKLQREQEVERRAQKKAKAAAKAGQTPKTQEAAVPASGRPGVPTSTAQKSVAPPKVDEPPQSSMPRSSPCPPVKNKRSTKTAHDDESGELEVEPPSFVGKRKNDSPQDSIPAQTTVNSGDEDDDEMLFDGAKSGCAPKHSSRDATPQRPRASNVYNRSLPVPSSGRRTEVSPLEGLERWARNGFNGAKQNGPEIIDIGEEEDETNVSTR